MIWLAASLIFWISLAFLETGRAVIINIMPPPLGRSVMPSAVDIRLAVAAVSLYSLFSLPWAGILFLSEKVLCRLKEKIQTPLLDLNCMDLFLLAAWGLASFKWISGERMDAQLDEAARTFLANPAKGLVPGPDAKTAKVSSIFKWFGDDFGVAGGVSRFILTKAEPALASRIAGLTEAGLSYLEYDWSLNDSARSS